MFYFSVFKRFCSRNQWAGRIGSSILLILVFTPEQGLAEAERAVRGSPQTEVVSQPESVRVPTTTATELARLDRLAVNPKFLNAPGILKALRQGALTISVIITLKPTAAANALAAASQQATKIPDGFDKPGEPVFFDLRNQAIRDQLRGTVEEKVNRVTQQIESLGVKVTHRFSYQFGFAADVTATALEQILANPEVIRVEQNHILEPHLKQGIPLIKATAPRSSYDGNGMSIAICDTGIDTRHPMLGGSATQVFNSKVIGGYDTGDNDPYPFPDPTSGHAHGTACAGIAAGTLGTSGDYIGGVAPGAKLYAIKISYGTGGSATDAAMVAGWEWAITHQNDDPSNPIQVISTSFGGGDYSGTCDSEVPTMTTAAANAEAAGITVFASSGNDGYCSSMGWPACISHVVSVGAVYDANLGGEYGWCVAASSCATKEPNAGCSTGFASWETPYADHVTAYSNSASFLTLFAPSNDAYTTTILGRGNDATKNYDTDFGGTSAACPYAAGAAAVLQSAAKAKTGVYLTPSKVKELLTVNGDAITDGKVAITKPRINLTNSVNAITPSSFCEPCLPSMGGWRATLR